MRFIFAALALLVAPKWPWARHASGRCGCYAWECPVRSRAMHRRDNAARIERWEREHGRIAP